MTFVERLTQLVNSGWQVPNSYDVPTLKRKPEEVKLLHSSTGMIVSLKLDGTIEIV